MKKFLFLLIVFAGHLAVAQTDGMRYQTIIFDPSIQVLPGENINGSILPDREVQLRFTLFDQAGSIEFQEVQNTRTDSFAQVDVIIGQGQAVNDKVFYEIQWDGTEKTLQVEVRLGGQFSVLSEQRLTYLPYALHRDLIATGDVDIEGRTQFAGDLEVEGETNLNGIVRVQNQSETNLSGTLEVDGPSRINGLEVTQQNPSNLSGTLRVRRATTLNNALSVEGVTQLQNRLNVFGVTQLDNTLTTSGATSLRDVLNVLGTTRLRNDLRVTGAQPTTLTGTLTVDGVTNLNADVNINNGSMLSLSGDFNVNGAAVFNDDLTVNGVTFLNGPLGVNNTSPTLLSGELNVDGRTTLQDTIQVKLATNLENLLRVNNQSPTALTGTLTVGLAANFNSALSVNNESPTTLSGPLNTQGISELKDDLVVDGVTNFNGSLLVNNQSEVSLSGTLRTDGATQWNATLDVDGVTTLNNTLEVANTSATSLTGTLGVDGVSSLENTLTVANQSASNLGGSLAVDGITTLQDAFNVIGNSQLSGRLNVSEATQLNNTLEVNAATKLTGSLDVEQATTLNDFLVANSAATLLTGSLQVDGTSTFDNTLTINGATNIDNSLTVTGGANFSSLTSSGMTVQGDNPNFLATFDNLNAQNGDGIIIQLGRVHGAWDGSGIRSLPNPVASELSGPLNVLKNRLQAPSPTPLTTSDMIQLSPNILRTAATVNTSNLLFAAIRTDLDLPVAFPNLETPFRTLFNGLNIWGGTSRRCSGQTCFSVCFPFAGCTRVCVPPVNVCVPGIPRIEFPRVNMPSLPVQVPSIPNLSNYIPNLPVNLPFPGGLPNVSIPDIPRTDAANSLTKENEYLTFVDANNLKTGTVRAQSLTDFRDNTILDNVYVLNVVASFVNIDLAETIAAGTVEMTNLIDAFNEIGVEYSSGNGDYAEWLERRHLDEYITAGDIVGVRGGFISKDLTGAEQVMVVSHRPIVLGNAPEDAEAFKGNTVAFMGQVPVKIMGPVQSGDYIIPHDEIPGYGRAVSKADMKTADFTQAVGRAWNTHPSEGPKVVNVVVGVQNGDWTLRLNAVDQKQNTLDAQLNVLSQQLDAIELQLNTSKESTYADQ